MSALKSHETAALWALFDEVFDQGAAFSLKSRFRRWFEADHFAVQLRRDLRALWSNYLTERGITNRPSLDIGEMGERVILTRGDIYFPTQE